VRALLLASVASVVVWLYLPVVAYAQTPFSTRDAFLAADPTAVRATLGAIPLADSIALDSLVRGGIPAVSDFFQLSPDVFWADGQGSSSHPSAGVALDRKRLATMRATLGARDFGDIVLFILAHEFAHMGQFRHYSLNTLRDVANLKAIECQADLWAGAMMINHLIDSTPVHAGREAGRAVVATAVDDRFARIRQALALAYQIGTPVWDDPSTHPLPSKRELCVARGVNGGIYMRLVRSYEQSHNSTLLSQINEWRAKDPQLFGLGTELWAWTNAEARRIVESKGVRSSANEGRPSLIEGLRTLVSSAEQGAERFRKEASIGLPWTECSTINDLKSVWVTCKDSSSLSAQMQADSYNNYRTMVRGVVLPRGWSETPEQVVNGGDSTSTVFRSPNGNATVTVFFVRSGRPWKAVFVSVLAKT